MNKKSKLQDIAKKAKVSITTASAVLNGKSEKYRISKATEEHVLKIANSLNYVRNFQAAALRSGKSQSIGLILPDFLHWGFSRLSHELEIYCNQHNLQLMISTSHDNPENEKSVASSMVSRGIDGLFVISSLLNYRFYQEILSPNTPVILLDRCAQTSPYPSVTSDDSIAVQSLLDNLKNQGAKNIAYLGGKKDLSTTNIRDIEVKNWENKNQQNIIKIHKGYSLEDGFKMSEKLFQENSNIDGILCASFTILEGFLRYKEQNKLPQPYLATIGDHKLLELMGHKISSARQDYKEMAKHAFQIFLNYDQLKNQHIRMSRKIILRK